MKPFYNKIFLSVIICFFFGFTNGAFATDWKLLKPSKGKKVSLNISGKKRTYWKMDKSNQIVVNITGPSELKMITRMVLPGDEKEGVYSFITHLNDEKLPLTARATQYSMSTKYPKISDQRIGQSRTIILNIAPGENKYTFSLPEDTQNVVYARFLAPDIKPKENISYIAFLPRSFSDEVKITVKEHEYIYYRSNAEKPVEIEVIGPSKIKCISRLEIDYKMRGNKPYRIQVVEGDSIVLTDFFTAEISATAEYLEKSEKVIGKGEVLYIDVPEGVHRYSVSTPDPDQNVIFRFYIPEKDLGNDKNLEQTTRAGLVRW